MSAHDEQALVNGEPMEEAVEREDASRGGGLERIAGSGRRRLRASRGETEAEEEESEERSLQQAGRVYGVRSPLATLLRKDGKGASASPAIRRLVKT
jgi:hypothetical protein